MLALSVASLSEQLHLQILRTVKGMFSHEIEDTITVNRCETNISVLCNKVSSLTSVC